MQWTELNKMNPGEIDDKNIKHTYTSSQPWQARIREREEQTFLSFQRETESTKERPRS